MSIHRHGLSTVVSIHRRVYPSKYLSTVVFIHRRVY